MTNNKSKESRRKLLKSITAGSGAIVAGKSLPDSWRRPIVDSVMLPAHAQTSPQGATCGPATATAIEGSDTDEDRVNIIYDGSSGTCNTIVTNDPSTDPDVVMVLDASATGGDAGTWDNEGPSPGGNWSLNSSAPDLGGSGSFSYTATRTGGSQYSLTLDVDITQTVVGPTDEYEMRVSNIVFTPI